MTFASLYGASCEYNFDEKLFAECEKLLYIYSGAAFEYMLKSYNIFCDMYAFLTLFEKSDKNY